MAMPVVAEIFALRVNVAPFLTLMLTAVIVPSPENVTTPEPVMVSEPSV